MPQDKKEKKPLTRAQKKLRYDIRRYSILGGLAVGAIAVLVLVIFLITLPFRMLSNKEEPVPSPSITEEQLSPSPTPIPEPKTLSLMAVGDNLIHNTVYEYARQADGTYDFTDIYSYIAEDLQEADIACIQQETIFVSDPSLYSNYPAFGTPVEMADSLASVGFDVVCHASNHTYDKMMTGLNDTFAAWENHPEVTVLGIHESQEDADAISVVEKNGIRLAMLDYTYGLNYGLPETAYSIDMLTEENREHIGAQIDAAKQVSDMVIIFMHTGTEDSNEPDEEQIGWAQFFADKGVGLVIGTHPHAIQPTDIITGINGNQMPIFYSLGNFVSSQKATWNMLGGMAKVTITKDHTGTYVSDFHMEPIVTWIQKGGTYGAGYIFHTLHLEDYTAEMAAQHIRENCSVEDFQTLWDSVMNPEAESSSAAEDSTLPNT